MAVLSAMYGVTNKLIEAAAAALRGDSANVARLRGELHALHRSTLQGAWRGGAGVVGWGAVGWSLGESGVGVALH